VVPAIVYVASASHEPASWDTAELQGVPYILGIAHPTGFPFYVLLGYAWSHLLPLGSVAFRMNAMSAVAAAGAVALAYALAVELGAPRPVALLASLWLAFTHDIWQHAARAETQDLALLLSGAAVYAFVRWLRGGDGRWFLGAFAAYGLSLATHPNAMWVLPGFVAGALVAKRRPHGKQLAAAALAMLAGVLFYTYLPLRSAYVVAHGADPAHVLAGAPGGLFWNYDDPSTPAGLRLELTGAEFGAPAFLPAALDPAHYQAAFWALLREIAEQYGAFALALAVVGLVALWRRDWRVALVLLASCTFAVLFATIYTMEADVARYELLALWMVAPLLALAAPSSTDVAGAVGRFAYAIALATGAAIAFSAGTGNFVHAKGEGGRWIIDAVKPLTAPGSVVIAEWLDATSLAYGAYVDDSLPGRIVVGSQLSTMLETYREWARRRPVYLLADPTGFTLAPSQARPAGSIDAAHALYRILPQR
ncbi:MAG TPA: DUF2723 domain-containing protein, partial [Verrucomicrobiae bacterium]|nr:DUF2723 domain-containing protein [Verrucomicrobiae bacterium]